MVRVVSTSNLDRNVYRSAVSDNEADGIVFDPEPYNEVEEYCKLSELKTPEPSTFSLGKSVSTPHSS